MTVARLPLSETFVPSLLMLPHVACRLTFTRPEPSMLRKGARITKLRIFAITILAAAGASCEVGASAADVVPNMVSLVTMATAPKRCASGWDFIAMNCELTWQGITLYGTIDAGGGWQSHGAPLDPRSAPGASYLIEKMNRSSRWTLAPNALSTSTIGIKGTEPIGGEIFLFFSVYAGFAPYSFPPSHWPGSPAAHPRAPPHQPTPPKQSHPAGPTYHTSTYV